MIKVGVIRGGVSPQYETSLATGGQVLSVLRTDEFKDKYKVFDMLLDKEGILHINGLPIGVEDIHSRVDVVFNALHGDFGADGKLQQILEHWNIPYTGSGIFPSAMSSNRKLAKYKFHSLGLNTPPYIIVSNYNPEYDGEESTYATRKAREVWNKMPAPWIVKPILMGSGVARHACKTFPELVRAFEEAMRHGISVVVEELIEGRTASVSVTTDWHKTLMQESGGFDAIVDGACGDTFAKLTEVAKPGGRIVFYGATLGAFNSGVPAKIFWKQLDILGSTMGNDEEFAEMIQLVANHKIVPVVDSVFKMNDASNALEKMEQSSQFGKLVIQID
jgi:D-alanine--D-alanine ligase